MCVFSAYKEHEKQKEMNDIDQLSGVLEDLLSVLGKC